MKNHASADNGQYSHAKNKPLGGRLLVDDEFRGEMVPTADIERSPAQIIKNGLKIIISDDAWHRYVRTIFCGN